MKRAPALFWPPPDTRFCAHRLFANPWAALYAKATARRLDWGHGRCVLDIPVVCVAYHAGARARHQNSMASPKHPA